MLKHFPMYSQEQQLMCTDYCWRAGEAQLVLQLRFLKKLGLIIISC